MTARWIRANRAAGTTIRFHDLRHWHASVSIDSGASVRDVASRLGHSKPSITLDVYGHLITDRGAALAEAASRALTQGTP